jgi:hypothetical protein
MPPKRLKQKGNKSGGSSWNLFDLFFFLFPAVVGCFVLLFISCLVA